MVPPPGEGVRAAALGVDGVAQTLTVTTAPDGTVRISDLGAEAAAPPDVAPAEDYVKRVNEFVDGGPAECDDDFYHFWQNAVGGEGWKWKKTMLWWFRAGSTPDYIDRDAARADVHRAARNVVTTRNNCGMADAVSASQDFQGDTVATVNIYWDGRWDTCGANDGKSVVAFGALGTKTSSMTCTWYRDDGTAYNSIEEADTRFNTNWNFRWYAGETPFPCDYQYTTPPRSIEASKTASFAFAYGLDYIHNEDHPHLTMSGTGTCSTAKATLGKGDILGLRALY